MSEQIDLTKFCAEPHSYHGYLHHPWTRDGWTYATNGHICVRVPARADVAENTEAPDVARVFASFPDSGFVPVPPLHPSIRISDIRECPQCQGTGVTPPDCEDDCEACIGLGDVGETRLASFLGQPFDTRYLALIAAIPQCEAANGPSQTGWSRDTFRQLFFRFPGGGRGTLMPVRFAPDAPDMATGKAAIASATGEA